ncbi:protein ALP1-like [Teleopsis dalmanni]|uniref:protein ALP1-like n=2 Tax=Teleopsis dalmanni TaxID=139649 RepID=UPI000D329F22|nr:protein ALP1-like [Teleopsis dalmanni]
MSNNVIIASAAFIVISEGSKKKRKCWMSEFLNKRNCICTPLFKELDVKRFHNFCRMSEMDFDKILKLISSKISKEDTKFRKSITPAERLAVTLRFLATGDSFTSLEYLFRISKQSISKIVPEVCSALLEALKEYVKTPISPEEWCAVAKVFEQKWNFNNCIGAIDGKHCVLQAPFHSGSDYFNYKSSFSIVLLGIVDAEYKFLYANVGCQGRISDGGVFNNSAFYKHFKNETLGLPKEMTLPGSTNKVPFVFVADDAFPLKPNILKPYSGKHDKGSIERIFNYRLSRARTVVENTFGVLSSVFRVLRKPIQLQPEKASIIVLACIHLHNFLRSSSSSKHLYNPPGTLDSECDGIVTPGTWRTDTNDCNSFKSLRKVARKPPAQGEDIRKLYGEYFMDAGKIPWQDYYA